MSGTWQRLWKPFSCRPHDRSSDPAVSLCTCPTLSRLLYLPSTSHSLLLTLPHIRTTCLCPSSEPLIYNFAKIEESPPAQVEHVLPWTLRGDIKQLDPPQSFFVFWMSRLNHFHFNSAWRNVIMIGVQVWSKYSLSQDNYPDHSEIYATWKDDSLPDTAVRTCRWSCATGAWLSA